ncbi:helix-turn-helix domain-containing protein [Roseateles koreensis]|uniref:Helix-turn-helix transcriptional regulator n=1 Tax=Roseateles koreensis TaxID=2987526 RepID=A0ABT5KTQ7_9BURK|nr:helix-turn-helix transcriptional regulator [Roseateles koreensis]MDC8786315.1 helix-turn-helix transcriptional regulator [Roseateles koreensis]
MDETKLEGYALRKIFAAAVQAYRKKLGLSQEALGSKAGLHRTYVSQVEQCRQAATLDSIERMANALGVAPHLLLKAPREKKDVDDAS